MRITRLPGDVEQNPRYRAIERRDTRRAARILCAFFAVGFLAGTLLVIASAPISVPLVLVCAGESLVALVCWLVVAGVGRRHPTGVSLVVASTAVAALTTMHLAAPDLAGIAEALPLVPALVAIFIPWRLSVYLVWLSVYLAAAAVNALVNVDAGLTGMSALTVPIAGAAVGLFGFLDRRSRRVDAFRRRLQVRDLRLVEAIDQRELRRLNAELEQTARLDPLTNVGNRRRLEEDLAALSARISRYGGRYAIAMADIDDFKRYNDRYGHQAGDGALRAVADALTAAVRSGDVVYRYGGEEFLVILAEASLEQAMDAAERMRAAVFGLGLANPGSRTGPTLTISVGVTMMGLEAIDNPAAPISVADAALYEAKGGGRNRVVGRTSLQSAA